MQLHLSYVYTQKWCLVIKCLQADFTSDHTGLCWVAHIQHQLSLVLKIHKTHMSADEGGNSCPELQSSHLFSLGITWFFYMYTHDGITPCDAKRKKCGALDSCFRLVGPCTTEGCYMSTWERHQHYFEHRDTGTQSVHNHYNVLYLHNV